MLKGDIYILLSIFIWGFFPLITKDITSEIGIFTTLGIVSFIAAVYFFVLTLVKNEFSKIKTKNLWKFIFYIFFNGVGYYLLIFYGLQFTSAINGSIFNLFEIVFSFLFFGILFGNDKLGKRELIAGLFMLLGAFILIFPGEININKGDFFIILAMLIVPFSNQISKGIIKEYKINYLLFIRSIFTAIVMFILAYNYESSLNLDIVNNNFLLLMFSGIILLGFSKTLWLKGYETISVARASSFLAFYPVFTIFYSIIFYSKFPDFNQLFGMIPLMIGIIILYNLGDKKKR